MNEITQKWRKIGL